MIDRQSDRVPVRWPIQYERLLSDRWSGPHQALCVNVGGYGMLLLLEETAGKDEIFRLHMRDVNSDSPFTLARVRWSKRETQTSNKPMAGVEYVNTDRPKDDDTALRTAYSGTTNIDAQPRGF